MIEIKDLHVSFSIQGKKLEAVRGISFDIKPGEFVGLVGESGCGKTAAVQAILELEPAQKITGEVLFHGQKLDVKKARGRDIGMVFQDPMTALNPTMKIGDQIAEGLIYHKLASRKEARMRAAELLRLVGIPEYQIDQYPHSLSGGMRQRVLIAIAISCRPQLVIADEPTTALDVTIQAQILDLLQKVCPSLLLITHDLSIVASVCHRVLVMYGGKIVESGSSEEIFYRPKHPYTKMLLAAIPRIYDRHPILN